MTQPRLGEELSIAILSSAAVTGSAGSITALTTALACEYAGFKDVTVYHDTSNEVTDHSVELSPNASRILRALKVLDELADNSFEPQFIHQRSYRTGFQLAITALGAMAEGRYNAPFLHVQSSALTAVLAEAANARGIHLQRGRSLTDLQYGDTHNSRIALKFNPVPDNTQPAAEQLRTHDVVLVADDPQQRARTLSNAEPLVSSSTPVTHWRGTTPHEDLPPGAFAAVITQWLGPKQHLSYHFTAGGQLLEFNALAETRNSTRQELLSAFANWHPSIGLLIESATILGGTPIISTGSVQRLAYGNLAFLGACCHTISPHLPQQHALGIEDAWVVSRMLEQWDDEPASGLMEFERYRLPRARRMHVQASARAEQLCDTRALETWRRNLAMTFGSRFLPELAMQKNDWLYGYDAVNGFE